MEQQELTTPDRRSVMQVCGLISLGLLGVPTLVACGSDDESSDTTGGGTAAAGAAGTVLAKLADIPVGGALVTKGADGKPIALVQATAGTVTAVSAVCTHQGTTVAAASGELDCPSHGSKFGFDGAVKNGPATTPLAAVAVKVDGENVVSA
ncbi:ubiquinol-cytochrome c reductase iron-sulfur subunit [Kineosporia sp. R_H_3]|uniref:QcrA and Rieske domain-containing protein n=1 Tax=Kineosporia sp. R_H_3 TaxID=1961848 RepID=UPI0018E9FD63|nr:Rieske (2Fe-2S) protein [Kineosporia sp. R_H_3]